MRCEQVLSGIGHSDYCCEDATETVQYLLMGGFTLNYCEKHAKEALEDLKFRGSYGYGN